MELDLQKRQLQTGLLCLGGSEGAQLCASLYPGFLVAGSPLWTALWGQSSVWFTADEKAYELFMHSEFKDVAGEGIQGPARRGAGAARQRGSWHCRAEPRLQLAPHPAALLPSLPDEERVARVGTATFLEQSLQASPMCASGQVLTLLAG